MLVRFALIVAYKVLGIIYRFFRRRERSRRRTQFSVEGPGRGAMLVNAVVFAHIFSETFLDFFAVDHAEWERLVYDI